MLQILLIALLVFSSCAQARNERPAITSVNGGDEALTPENATNGQEMAVAEFNEIALTPKDMPCYYARSRDGVTNMTPESPPGDESRMDVTREVWCNRDDNTRQFTVTYYIYGSLYKARRLYEMRMPRGVIPERPEERLGDDAFREFDTASNSWSITFRSGRAFVKVGSNDRLVMAEVCHIVGQKAATKDENSVGRASRSPIFL